MPSTRPHYEGQPHTGQVSENTFTYVLRVIRVWCNRRGSYIDAKLDDESYVESRKRTVRPTWGKIKWVYRHKFSTVDAGKHDLWQFQPHTFWIIRPSNNYVSPSSSSLVSTSSIISSALKPQVNIVWVSFGSQRQCWSSVIQIQLDTGNINDYCSDFVNRDQIV